MDEIVNICHNILVQTPGVSRVILADKTGLTLVNLSRFDFDLRDVEVMGAISSAVYLASEQQGANVGFTEMTMLVAEFKKGKIMVASCGSAVLCVITDNDVALGMARMTINQAAQQISKILDERIEESEAFEQTLTKQVMEDIEKIDDTTLNEDEFLSELQSALKELEQF